MLVTGVSVDIFVEDLGLVAGIHLLDIIINATTMDVTRDITAIKLSTLLEVLEELEVLLAVAVEPAVLAETVRVITKLNLMVQLEQLEQLADQVLADQAEELTLVQVEPEVPVDKADKAEPEVTAELGATMVEQERLVIPVQLVQLETQEPTETTVMVLEDQLVQLVLEDQLVQPVELRDIT